MEFDPSDYFDDRFIEDSIHKNAFMTTDLGKVFVGLLSKAKDILKSRKPVKVAEVLTEYLQIFRPDDFILKKLHRS